MCLEASGAVSFCKELLGRVRRICLICLALCTHSGTLHIAHCTLTEIRTMYYANLQSWVDFHLTSHVQA